MPLQRKIFTPLVLLLALSGGTITACGKKGPLYLPPPPTDTEFKAEREKKKSDQTPTEQSQ